MGPEQCASAALVTGDKEWHGHPLAAIRMAWKGLGAVRNDTVPAITRQKLALLLDPYRAPLDQSVETLGHRPPSPPPPSSPRHDHKEGSGGDGDGNVKGKGKGKEKAVGGFGGTKKRRARLTAEQTLAGKKAGRDEAAGKQHHFTNANEQPLYDNAAKILKWIEETDP